MNDANNSQVEQLLQECQKYKYDQSSNYIKLARSVVFGIIGTIWILSYSDGKFEIHNTCLINSLLFAFLHILIDLIHYFWDMIFYKREYVRFDEERQYIDDAIKQHDQRMDKNANISFYFVCASSIILLLTVVSFIKGFIFQFDVF